MQLNGKIVFLGKSTTGLWTYDRLSKPVFVSSVWYWKIIGTLIFTILALIFIISYPWRSSFALSYFINSQVFSQFTWSCIEYLKHLDNVFKTKMIASVIKWPSLNMIPLLNIFLVCSRWGSWLNYINLVKVRGSLIAVFYMLCISSFGQIMSCDYSVTG